MLEACIEMGLEPKLDDDWIMVTVNMSIYPVKTLEELADKGGKRLGKRNTWYSMISWSHRRLSEGPHQFCWETSTRCRYYSEPMP